MSPLWRYRCEFAGTEKMLVLGKYPDVSLADVREARDWFAVRSPTWVPRHATICMNSLEGDVFLVLSRVPIRKITTPMMLELLSQH